jgi:hypothetical protein
MVKPKLSITYIRFYTRKRIVSQVGRAYLLYQPIRVKFVLLDRCSSQSETESSGLRQYLVQNGNVWNGFLNFGSVSILEKKPRDRFGEKPQFDWILKQ